ncbi:hypothetical protein G7054_g3816 [Neopestalotiopsis clavispora]|nr:hypothetical protein G7054_g3816 [Neopestalotiopsis clavispora]
MSSPRIPCASDVDDWSGISSSNKRRKIQNRLNQRAYRARNRRLGVNKQDDGSRANTDIPLLHRELIQSGCGSSGCISMSDLKKLINSVTVMQVYSEETKSALQAFEAFAHHLSLHASPSLEFLPILTQFHFTRGLMANIEVMSLSQNQMHDDALSPFNTAGPLEQAVVVVGGGGIGPRWDFLPRALRPTELQVAIPHHPWIDLLPSPQLRDNILLALENDLDEDDLCQAFSGRTKPAPPGVIVWKDPWVSDGWEISEALARSHGWILKDCWELFESTNKWRARRGERPLFPRRP